MTGRLRFRALALPGPQVGLERVAHLVAGLLRELDFALGFVQPAGQHQHDSEVVVGFANRRVHLQRGAPLAFRVGEGVGAEKRAAERDRDIWRGDGRRVAVAPPARFELANLIVDLQE